MRLDKLSAKIGEDDNLMDKKIHDGVSDNKVDKVDSVVTTPEGVVVEESLALRDAGNYSPCVPSESNPNKTEVKIDIKTRDDQEPNVKINISIDLTSCNGKVERQIACTPTNDPLRKDSDKDTNCACKSDEAVVDRSDELVRRGKRTISFDGINSKNKFLSYCGISTSQDSFINDMRPNINETASVLPSGIAETDLGDTCPSNVLDSSSRVQSDSQPAGAAALKKTTTHLSPSQVKVSQSSPSRLQTNARFKSVCWSCGGHGKNVCSRCKIAMYCSTKCQSDHYAEHKLFCTRGMAAGPLTCYAGLPNRGNTCYLASSVQCLLSCSLLRDYFVGGYYRKEINAKNILGHKGVVAEAFANILRELWVCPEELSMHPRRNVNIEPFLTIIRNTNCMFADYGQHDAQELLSFLLDALHEDLNRCLTKPVSERPARKPDESIAQCAERFSADITRRDDSTIHDLIAGMFMNRLKCLSCGYVSDTFERFCLLPLPLPSVAHITFKCFYFRLPIGSDPIVVHLTGPRTLTFSELKKQISQLTGVSLGHLVIGTPSGQLDHLESLEPRAKEAPILAWRLEREVHSKRIALQNFLLSEPDLKKRRNAVMQFNRWLRSLDSSVDEGARLRGSQRDDICKDVGENWDVSLTLCVYETEFPSVYLETFRKSDGHHEIKSMLPKLTSSHFACLKPNDSTWTPVPHVYNEQLGTWEPPEGSPSLPVDDLDDCCCYQDDLICVPCSTVLVELRIRLRWSCNDPFFLNPRDYRQLLDKFAKEDTVSLGTVFNHTTSTSGIAINRQKVAAEIERQRVRLSYLAEENGGLGYVEKSYLFNRLTEDNDPINDDPSQRQRRSVCRNPFDPLIVPLVVRIPRWTRLEDLTKYVKHLMSQQRRKDNGITRLGSIGTKMHVNMPKFYENLMTQESRDTDKNRRVRKVNIVDYSDSSSDEEQLADIFMKDFACEKHADVKTVNDDENPVISYRSTDTSVWTTEEEDFYFAESLTMLKRKIDTQSERKNHLAAINPDCSDKKVRRTDNRSSIVSYETANDDLSSFRSSGSSSSSAAKVGGGESMMVDLDSSNPPMMSKRSISDLVTSGVKSEQPSIPVEFPSGSILDGCPSASTTAGPVSDSDRVHVPKISQTQTLSCDLKKRALDTGRLSELNASASEDDQVDFTIRICSADENLCYLCPLHKICNGCVIGSTTSDESHSHHDHQSISLEEVLVGSAVKNFGNHFFTNIPVEDRIRSELMVDRSSLCEFSTSNGLTRFGGKQASDIRQCPVWLDPWFQSTTVSHPEAELSKYFLNNIPERREFNYFALKSSESVLNVERAGGADAVPNDSRQSVKVGSIQEVRACEPETNQATRMRGIPFALMRLWHKYRIIDTLVAHHSCHFVLRVDVRADEWSVKRKTAEGKEDIPAEDSDDVYMRDIEMIQMRSDSNERLQRNVIAFEKMARKVFTSIPLLFKNNELNEMLRAGTPEMSICASLEYLIRKCTVTETLHGDEAWKCDKCGKREKSSKKHIPWAFGDIVLVQLIRFSASANLAKNTRAVSFPLRDLDLSKHLGVQHYKMRTSKTDQIEPQLYELVGCISHNGRLGGGHVRACSLTPRGWFAFDDDVVSPIEDPNEYFQGEERSVYVLAYQRQRPNDASRLSPGLSTSKTNGS